VYQKHLLYVNYRTERDLNLNLNLVLKVLDPEQDPLKKVSLDVADHHNNRLVQSEMVHIKNSQDAVRQQQIQL